MPTVILFAATMFVSATLLFMVQPMFAKMVLPLVGGTAAVWNTCVLFFQLTLLGGYAWAHVSLHWLDVRRQAVLQMVLLALPLVVLPIGIPPGWFPPGGESPIRWLLAVLFVAVGLPFLAVSTTAPTLQRWFSATGHRSAHDPYFLYAASNFGSILALLLYPVVVEPLLRLRTQALVWTLGYGTLIALTWACSLTVRRRERILPAAAGQAVTAAAPNASRPLVSADDPPAGTPDPVVPDGFPPESDRIADRPLTLRRRLRWLALAAVPSSLMLGVTTFLSTDISPMPLLWVVPLSLYLLTFVIAFSPRLRVLRAAGPTLMAVLILPLVLLLVTATAKPLWMVVPLHLAAFFVTALVCHGELAKDRPRPESLTEFYLWMSVGGMLGGLFNTLIAPAVFSVVAEYPLMLAAACLLRPAPPESSTPVQRALDVALPLAFAALTVAAVLGVKHYTARDAWRLSALGAVLLACFLASRRPVRFGLGLGAIMIAGFLTWGDRTDVEHRERTFFGLYQIELDRGKHLRTLMNGTTMHGVQSLYPDERDEPLSYYHRTGPIGQVLELYADRLAGSRIAVVGLGTGTLAAYARASERWTFFEIDPAVVRLSNDRRYFTFLSGCGERCTVVLGDARISLGRTPARSFALIVLDAFSSDAIPVHLITREALALYLAKLANHGLIAFHVSNRHLELQPVVGRLARDLHVVAYTRSEEVTDEQSDEGMSGSDWVVVARSADDLGPLKEDARWTRLDGQAGPDWTDDFSNILAVLSWK